MKKIRNERELKARIDELMVTKELEKHDLKEHFVLVKETFRPKNLIRSTIREVTSAPGVKGKFMTVVLGLTAGYLAKKAIFGTSHNPIRKMAGTLLQMGIAGMISKNSGTLKDIGSSLLSKVINRSKRKYVEEERLDGVEHF